MRFLTSSIQKSAKPSSTNSAGLTPQGWQRVKAALNFARADDQRRGIQAPQPRSLNLRKPATPRPVRLPSFLKNAKPITPVIQ
jgi:hypothetical protein